MKNYKWKIVAASAKGKGHAECQDSFCYDILDKLAITVVADGAGSQKNSKFGSSLASKITLKLFKQYVTENSLDKYKISQDKWREDSISILKQVKEKLKKVAFRKKFDINTMASTIIVSILTFNTIYTIHIGDGRAGYMNGNQEWKSLITPYHGEEVGMTVFLTTDYIWQFSQDYIETNIIEDNIQAVTLLSDGAENASYECIIFDKEKQKYINTNKPYSGFYNPLVEFVLNNKNSAEEDLNIVWKKFLEDGTPSFITEHDDKTILLAVKYEISH